MNKQTGFTLIELAIVLVIIGLLLGGVLRGQELINSARVKNMARDFQNIQVYIYGYQDRFRALPGDDHNAVAHVGGTNPANGTQNGVIQGIWDTALMVMKPVQFGSMFALLDFLQGLQQLIALLIIHTNLEMQTVV